MTTSGSKFEYHVIPPSRPRRWGVRVPGDRPGVLLLPLPRTHGVQPAIGRPEPECPDSSGITAVVTSRWIDVGQRGLGRTGKAAVGEGSPEVCQAAAWQTDGAQWTN